MILTKVLFVAIASCFLIVLLNQHKPEFSLLIRFAAILIIICLLIKPLIELSSSAAELSEGIKLNNEYIYLLIKALFVGIVCKIVCDICNDTGNKAVSTCVELTGQVTIMLLAIPLITALTGFAKGLLK
ncbi:MAG: stage III sporulation AC/AD family protein [Clostridia bacterium]|nr:stage III sporulation AC/AD family protein [Clostridia bacterium]